MFFKRAISSFIAIGAAKYIYDSGYEAGKSNRPSFFNEIKNATLRKVEDQLPPEEKQRVKQAVNELQHEVRNIENTVRRGLGWPPK